MTAHHQELQGSETDRFQAASIDRSPVRRSRNRIVRIGWNLASLLSSRIRETRDRAMFDDLEGAALFARKHQKDMRAQWRRVVDGYPRFE
ncbi:hypothetical protein IGS68_02660 [Skermanella sp. TT6]|uniref:Uncharacterized protein n=1 Tax=Skermanella cutis TaxID=2775420 RepID=A0ABX7B752_9PROT|nr:hypothetical protein [Skermanella sp. TT6]QQP90186.1 hypothetical protein IGS68_02660 [Skermanella sp. TT6]